MHVLINFVWLNFNVLVINAQSSLYTAETTKELQEKYLQLFDNPTLQNGDNHASGVAFLPAVRYINALCPKDTFFYDRNPKHMVAVMEMKKILTSKNSAYDFIDTSASFRGEIHPKVWLKAVLAATESRVDTRGLRKPFLVEVMPDKLVSYEAIAELRNQSPNTKNECVRLDEKFGADNGRDNRFWYFRENVMLNSFHWYWHLTYPTFLSGPEPDRRGELFYYMHHYAISRYNAERLSQGFPRVIPLQIQYKTLLEEGYYAHLNESNSKKPYTDRPPNTILGDVYLDGTDPDLNPLSVATVIQHLQRILNAIDSGSFDDENGNVVSLQNFMGIDILGNIVEASTYSKNPSYFGRAGVHGDVHDLIGYVMDANNLEPNVPLIPGVMEDTATAMRDPTFYRWHKYIDDLFDRHKQTLPPYTPSGGEFPLSNPIRIRSLNIESSNGTSGILRTFWSEKTFDLSRGLNFCYPNKTETNCKPLRLCVKHLNHEDFRYKISIRKGHSAREVNSATVRIFMAPRYDEMGQRLSMIDQRILFFMLDIFTIKLKGKRRIISRSSRDTPITLSFADSYNELQSSTQRTNCGCGWPHQLLIPKGNETGVVFDLFAMITVNDEIFSSSEIGCHQATILCGLFKDKYPYKHPMGYPFDRLPHNISYYDMSSIWFWQWKQVTRPVANLDEYITGIPNMATTQVTIFHTDNLKST